MEGALCRIRASLRSLGVGGARVGGGLVVGAGIASLDRRREEARCGEGLFVVSGIASLARH